MIDAKNLLLYMKSRVFEGAMRCEFERTESSEFFDCYSLGH